MRPYSVLVVDDDPENREMIATILEDESCVVHQSGDGIDAMLVASPEDTDLVILDMLLPDVGGTEVTQWLKDRFPTLPILALSASLPDLRTAFTNGADACLAKPFQIQELLDLVEQLCARD